MKFNVEYEIHKKEQKAFTKNWVKKYALIYDKHWSIELQVMIKELPDYKSDALHIPSGLLESVELRMHTPQGATYPTLTLAETLHILLNLIQMDNYDLLNYLGRLKSEKNVVMILFGKNILNGFLENTKSYKDLLSTDN